MVIEDYVSFQIAKLLKEKGFDEPCHALYHNGDDKIFFGLDVDSYHNSTLNVDCYACPTLQMAMKWLREVHHSTIDVFHFRDWKVNIKTIPDDYFKADYSYPELKPAETYEQACEAGIKYYLEYLI